jgi:hypothetical protein
VIMKRGLYYLPNAKGYTNNISEAWIVTEEEADKHTYPYDEPVTKRSAPVPSYYKNLNAIHEASLLLTDLLYVADPSGSTTEKRAYLRWLFRLCGGKEEAISATAPQRCEAILRAIGKWKESKQTELQAENNLDTLKNR